MLSLGYLWCDLQPDDEEASPPRNIAHKDEIWRRSPIPIHMDTKRFNFYAKDDSTLLRDYPYTQNLVKWKKQRKYEIRTVSTEKAGNLRIGEWQLRQKFQCKFSE